MDVHPTYEGEVTIHKYRNTCCSKKLSCKLKLAHSVVLKIVLQFEAIVQVNYIKSCVYPINISQLILHKFTQRNSTLAPRGGGLTYATVVDGGVGVRSLLLVGAPSSLGSARGSVSVRTGAVMQQGGVRSGCFLTDAPCSSVVVAMKGSRHDSGDDGVPTETATMGLGGGDVRSSRFLGDPATTACEGNKKFAK
jgi:hypothetical protein